MMINASVLFENRILKNQLPQKIGKLAHKVTKLYDESELQKVLSFINSKNINGRINFPLDKIANSKPLDFKKGEKREVDVFVIIDKTLIIMEFKNFEPDLGMTDEAKTKKKIRLEIRKMVNLKNKIMHNQLHFSNIFGGSFNNIELYMSFKYPVAALFTLSNPEISLIKFDDFFKMLSSRVKEL